MRTASIAQETEGRTQDANVIGCGMETSCLWEEQKREGVEKQEDRQDGGGGRGDRGRERLRRAGSGDGHLTGPVWPRGSVPSPAPEDAPPLLLLLFSAVSSQPAQEVY